MERLMDVRFLSVEFLNTYLTTYRIFSDAIALLDTLLQWYYSRAQFVYPAGFQHDILTSTSDIPANGKSFVYSNEIICFNENHLSRTQAQRNLF